MGQNNADIGHSIEQKKTRSESISSKKDDFVLEKSIFNNIFEKDIRRVYIYKKAERLAKAIYLITPAFAAAMSLKDRLDKVALNLIDGAVLPLAVTREQLSRELLTLLSILSVAKTSGTLSSMNSDLIQREVQLFLHEIASYEEPRVALEEVPTLSDIAKSTPATQSIQPTHSTPRTQLRTVQKGHIKDNSGAPQVKDRREAVLSVIRQKGRASIKDISTIIRSVSEKTIQRELLTLVTMGLVRKEGERRWSVYSLA